MIEYRKLKQDGHCSLCGEEIKKLDKETTIEHFYHKSKNPIVYICRECAYKNFLCTYISE